MFRKVLKLFMVFALLVIQTPILTFAADDALAISSKVFINSNDKKDVDDLLVKAGEDFIMEVSFGVQDIENHYHNVKIEIDLPEDINFLGCKPEAFIKNCGPRESNKLIIEVSDDGSGSQLSAGTSAKLEINLEVKNDGTIDDNFPYSISSKINSDTVADILSNNVNVRTYGSQSYWRTDKRRLSSRLEGDGVYVNYRVELEESSGTNLGRILITDPELVDNFENGAKVYEGTTLINDDESLSNGGVVDYDTNTITWKFSGTYSSRIYKDITIFYPNSEVNFQEGNKVRNNVSATSLNIPSISSDYNDFTIVGPRVGNLEGYFKKGRTFAYRYEGQQQSYTLTGIANNNGDTNIPLTNFVVEDVDLPYEVEYASIRLPLHRNVTDYIFEYKTNLKDWIELDFDSVSISKNGGTLNVSSDLDLSNNHYLGEYLTGIRITYGKVPLGFASTNIIVNGIVRNHDKDGNQLNHNDVISNDVTYSYVGDSLQSFDRNALFTYKTPTAFLSLGKSKDKSSYIPGEDVRFDLSIQNQSGATGPFKNPVIYDLLPERFVFSGDFELRNAPSGINKSDFIFTVVSTDYNSTGRTLLKWELPNKELDVGQGFDIRYYTSILKYTSSGTGYSNELYVTSSTDKTFLNSGSKYDLFGDTTLLREVENITINNTEQTLTTLWTKGILDAEYKQYEETMPPFYNAGNTIQGGTADYKLTVKNEGNTLVKRIEILDILPFIGDEGVTVSTSRNTEWRPNLLKPLKEGNGITISSLDLDDKPSTKVVDMDVYYSTSSNKNFITLNKDIKNDTVNWMDSIPSYFDITSIQSLYIDISNIGGDDSGLAPGETIVLEWKMRAPVGTTENLVAWNSIGSRITTNNGTLPIAEPKKVGFKVSEDNMGQIGNYVWFDSNKNGLQDDGHDNQDSGINGIQVSLYRHDGDDFQKIDETLTANDFEGKPGFYLFPHLPSGTYYVKYQVPDYYTITTSNPNIEGVNGSEIDTDSNGEINGTNCSLETVPGYHIVCTNSFDLQVTPDPYPYPYRRKGIDLGLKPSSTMADFTVQKEVNKIKEQPILDPKVNSINKNETAQYLITITNTGLVPLNNIKIEDIMNQNQSGFKYTKIGFDTDNLIDIDSFPLVTNIVNSGSNPTVYLSTLNVGEKIFLQGEYIVKNSDIDNTPLENTVYVWSNETHSDDNEPPKQAKASIEISDMSIVKSALESDVYPGIADKNRIHYTITITNTGSTQLDNIELNDSLITAYTNIDNIKLSENLSTVTISSLNPGDSIDVEGYYDVGLVSLGNIVTNTATISHPDIRELKQDSVDAQTLGLSITKTETSTGPYQVGDEITYDIVVTNTSSRTLVNLQVTDHLFNKNEGVDYNEIDSYTIASLDAGKSDTRKVSYIVTKEDIENISSRELKNIAIVSGEGLKETAEATVELTAINLGEIGNLVWFDSNKDGIQNDGHNGSNGGINNVLVKLFRKNDSFTTNYKYNINLMSNSNITNPTDVSDFTEVGSMLTTNGPDGLPGYYLFDNLPQGIYYVEYLIPNEYTITGSLPNIEMPHMSENDEDSNAGYEGLVLRTEPFSLAYRETSIYPFKRYGIDLGVVPLESGKAELMIEKDPISVFDSLDTLLEKDPTIEVVQIGEKVLYQISLTNSGTVPLHNVKVTDIFDRNQTGFKFTKGGFDKDNLLDIISIPGLQIIDNVGNEPTLVIDKIGIGETFYLNGIYQVVSEDKDTTALENKIYVWSNETHSDSNTKPLTDKAIVKIPGIVYSSELPNTGLKDYSLFYFIGLLLIAIGLINPFSKVNKK